MAMQNQRAYPILYRAIGSMFFFPADLLGLRLTDQCCRVICLRPIKYKKYLQIEQVTEIFLNDKGYLKIDVPLLSPALIPESYLEVFETEFSYFSKKEKLFLTPSPE